MGNVYRRSISILLPMCVMNCGIAVASAQRGIEAEEYAVYAAVITEMFVRKDTKLVVINDQTLPMLDIVRTGDTHDAFKSAFPGLGSDIIEDYQTSNQRAEKLKEDFNLTVKYVLISDAALRGVFEGPDLRAKWKLFYEKYPDSPGVTGFSRVGFDAAKTQALLYVQNSCGGLCGAGNIVFLRKRNGVWTVTVTHMLWIS